MSVSIVVAVIFCIALPAQEPYLLALSPALCIGVEEVGDRGCGRTRAGLHKSGVRDDDHSAKAPSKAARSCSKSATV